MEKNSIFFLGVNLFLLLIEKSENWWKEVGDGSHKIIPAGLALKVPIENQWRSQFLFKQFLEAEINSNVNIRF